MYVNARNHAKGGEHGGPGMRSCGLDEVVNSAARRGCAVAVVWRLRIRGGDEDDRGGAREVLTFDEVVWRELSRQGDPVGVFLLILSGKWSGEGFEGVSLE